MTYCDCPPCRALSTAIDARIAAVSRAELEAASTAVYHAGREVDAAHHLGGDDVAKQRVRPNPFVETLTRAAARQAMQSHSLAPFVPRRRRRADEDER